MACFLMCDTILHRSQQSGLIVLDIPTTNAWDQWDRKTKTSAWWFLQQKSCQPTSGCKLSTPGIDPVQLALLNKYA
jgi:hypothetical protein